MVQKAQIIDGRNISQKHKAALKEKVARLTLAGHRPPHLAVVLVGEDPASQVYVGHKEKSCSECGFDSTVFRLPKESTESDIKAIVGRLNQDDRVDGILLQLPLPSHLDPFSIIELINPNKDVDGLTVRNQGLLAVGRPSLLPCTPKGIMTLLSEYGVELKGKRAAVIGRSQLVGSPIAKLLDRAGATVTVLHSKTTNPEQICSQADIVVAAAGVAQLVRMGWVKEQAVVIDVGIHRRGEGLVGDVNFAEVSEVAHSITPVPGGVGPMTIASLLENCMESYLISQGIK